MGRLFAVGINFTAQVLIVRHLSTTDYGALAYALAVVAFLQVFTTLRLGEASTRFVSIYHEKHDYDKVFGTILLMLSMMGLAGLGLIAAFFALPDPLLYVMIDDQQPIDLLSIMIFLAPVGALDSLLIGLFATFARPRAIFFRKHILGPGLKLIVVLLLIVWQRNVIFLAYGYLVASALGVLIYGGLFIRLLQRQGLFQHVHFKTLQMPVKAVCTFTLPLLTSTLFPIAMKAVNVFLLGYFHDMSQVAFFLVVLPAAELSTTMVMRSFALLYMPTAARLFAKEDYVSMQHLYWQTTVWMAVVAFPLFAVTFAMAQPFTTLVYGARYEQSAIILALLSLGCYVRVAFGFNERTLQVVGQVRCIVLINIVAAVTAIIANVLLIPPYGALGAATGTASVMIIHTLLRQAGLHWALGFNLFNRQCLSFYLLIAGSILGLFLMQSSGATSIPIALPLAVLLSLFVLILSKNKLQITETFPELLRLPFMRLIAG